MLRADGRSVVFGVLALPTHVALLLFHGENTLPFMGMTLGGVAGLWGLCLAWGEYRRREMGREEGALTKNGAVAVRVCALFGFCALAGYLYVALGKQLSPAEALLFGPSVLCSIHLLYVMRSVVFGNGEWNY